MHKPRSITRANAKKGRMEKMNDRISVYNDAGYCDPTPYCAIRNIEKQARLNAQYRRGLGGDAKQTAINPRAL